MRYNLCQILEGTTRANLIVLNKLIVSKYKGMHDYIELRPNVWKLHSLVIIHTIASMMRYFIKKKTQHQVQPGRCSLSHIVTYT